MQVPSKASILTDQEGEQHFHTLNVSTYSIPFVKDVWSQILPIGPSDNSIYRYTRHRTQTASTSSRSSNLRIASTIPSVKPPGTPCVTVQMANGWQEVRIPLEYHRPSSNIKYNIGAADPASHKIYIWDISNDGQFASALDGGREPLVHVHVRDTTECILSQETSL